MLASKLFAPAAAASAGLAGLYLSSGSAPKPVLTQRSSGIMTAFAGAAPAGATGPFGNPAHDWNYYSLCLMGGILSCG